MSVFVDAPKPKSALGYHRVLAPTAGIKVSPICLGGANFGDAWKDFAGECDKTQSYKIMDRFFELGGNFIDTAVNYQSGESEQWIGDWMEERGNRDQMVIATKYTAPFLTHERDSKPIQSNYAGTSLKSMRIAFDRSLKFLKTDYVDILYIHMWDFSSSIEEVMRGLNDLISAGKVLYLGISDTPAWIVVKANDYARQHGLRPFSVYQGLWNAATRDLERDILPMCQDQGMAVAPWGPLGQGLFRTAEARAKAHEGSLRASQPSEAELKVSEALEKVADRKGATLHGVALAYLLHKTPYAVPIVGQRKVEQLEANVAALSIELSDADMDEIEAAAPFDPGFPMNFIFRGNYNLRNTSADSWLVKMAAHVDVPAKQIAVRPRKVE